MNKKSKKIGLMIFMFLMIFLQIVSAQGVKKNEKQITFGQIKNSSQDILYLTKEQEEKTLNYMKEMYPDRFERFIKIKELRPLIYRRGLSRAYREMRFIEELKNKDQVRYQRVLQEKKLTTKSRILAKKYKETDDEDQKNRIREELKGILSELFNIRQQVREDEIERLEKKLAELKEINRKRLANKDAIVEKKLAEMLGENKDMEW